MTQHPRTTWNFWSAGRLIFGRGDVRQELGPAIRRLERERVLIITDRNLIDAGIASSVEEALERSGVATGVFSKGEPEPSRDVAAAFPQEPGG